MLVITQETKFSCDDFKRAGLKLTIQTVENSNIVYAQQLIDRQIHSLYITRLKCFIKHPFHM